MCTTCDFVVMHNTCDVVCSVLVRCMCKIKYGVCVAHIVVIETYVDVHNELFDDVVCVLCCVGVVRV